MRRPDDIPLDVWDMASSFMERSYPYGAKEFVSRAILAERERCAKIADYFCESAYSEGMSEDVVTARSYTAGDIAAAIRKGEQP